MKSFNQLVFVILFITFSCSIDSDILSNCSYEDPVKDLGWLASDVQEYTGSGMADYLYIYRATYKLKSVFVMSDCCPSCFSSSPVYNCSGELLGFVGPGKEGIDPDKLRNKEVIWKTDSCACNFNAIKDLN